MLRLIERHCQTVGCTIETPWLPGGIRNYADHSRFIPALFFDGSVRLSPAPREKLTNLFEIICIMLSVPSCPRIVGVAFGPPTFYFRQIFWRYGGATLHIPQEGTILFRIVLHRARGADPPMG
jgi:hypothetical protein